MSQTRSYPCPGQADPSKNYGTGHGDSFIEGDHGVNYSTTEDQRFDDSARAPGQAAKPDSLNFGWFELPRIKDDKGSGEGQRSESMSDANHHGPNQHVYDRHSSKDDGQRHNAGQHAYEFPLSEHSGQCGYVCPPSRQGGEPSHECPPSRNGQQQNKGCELADGRDGAPEETYLPVYDENIVINWPLSTLARGQMKYRPPPTSGQGPPSVDRPPSRAPSVPPTPMPPLAWGGYRQTARPTYASWREKWHKIQHSQSHNPYYNASCSNTNNNSAGGKDNPAITDDNGVLMCTVADRIDINNNHEQLNSRKHDVFRLFGISLAGTSGFKSKPREKMDGPRPMAKYGRSSYVVHRGPQFYKPNVVMEWEEEDESRGRTMIGNQFMSNSCTKKRPASNLKERVSTRLTKILSSVLCWSVTRKQQLMAGKTNSVQYQKFKDNIDDERHKERKQEVFIEKSFE